METNPGFVDDCDGDSELIAKFDIEVVEGDKA